MKAFVLTCLLAVATASPQLSHYGLLGSPLGYHGYSPLVLSPIAPLVQYPSSGAVVPADAPDVALAKIAHAQAHHEALSRGKRSPAYYGPPAPLNSDGTVAQTPEVAAAASYQSAAHQQELRRLADAAALAAAHPDTTSPQQSWDNGNQWRSAAPQQSWNAAPQQQSWNAAPQQQSWNAQPQPQQWARSYNPAATQPAPLNHDGTVAQTKEYQAIASAHAAAHQQLAAPQPYYGRRKRSVALNPDGSVAPTPEVAAATAAHLAAHAAARGYAPLAYSAPLTYGAPLALSPFSLYSGLPFYGRYAAHVPAPLNHDGTVAHTPEYLAVAASHAAAHHHALSRARRSVSLNPDGTVAPTPEVQAATAAHFAALARAGGAHYYGAPAVGYAAPYTTYAYHGTAPLNPDGTVAETPEVAHLAAAHRAAQSQQLGLLAQQEALARASGDYSGDYSGSYAGYAHSGYAAPVAYAGSYAHQPAPLNPDGTVAHTPEYRAIAASHAAAHYAH